MLSLSLERIYTALLTTKTRIHEGKIISSLFQPNYTHHQKQSEILSTKPPTSPSIHPTIGFHSLPPPNHPYVQEKTTNPYPIKHIHAMLKKWRRKNSNARNKVKKTSVKVLKSLVTYVHRMRLSPVHSTKTEGILRCCICVSDLYKFKSGINLLALLKSALPVG